MADNLRLSNNQFLNTAWNGTMWEDDGSNKPTWHKPMECYVCFICKQLFNGLSSWQRHYRGEAVTKNDVLEILHVSCGEKLTGHAVLKVEHGSALWVTPAQAKIDINIDDEGFVRTKSMLLKRDLTFLELNASVDDYIRAYKRMLASLEHAKKHLRFITEYNRQVDERSRKLEAASAAGTSGQEAAKGKRAAPVNDTPSSKRPNLAVASTTRDGDDPNASSSDA